VVLVLGLKISLVMVAPVFSVCHVGQFLQASANLCFVKKHFFPTGHPVKNSFAALFIFITLNSASNTIIGSVIALKIELSFSLVLCILVRCVYSLLTTLRASEGVFKCVDADFELYLLVNKLYSHKKILACFWVVSKRLFEG